jgi:hypothetical protein
MRHLELFLLFAGFSNFFRIEVCPVCVDFDCASALPSAEARGPPSHAQTQGHLTLQLQYTIYTVVERHSNARLPPVTANSRPISIFLALRSSNLLFLRSSTMPSTPPFCPRNRIQPRSARGNILTHGQGTWVELRSGSCSMYEHGYRLLAPKWV